MKHIHFWQRQSSKFSSLSSFLDFGTTNYNVPISNNWYVQRCKGLLNLSFWLQQHTQRFANLRPSPLLLGKMDIWSFDEYGGIFCKRSSWRSIMTVFGISTQDNNCLNFKSCGFHHKRPRGGGGGHFHIEGDGDVPLDRVWFCGHQYWHRVSCGPLAVINIGTGYLHRPNRLLAGYSVYHRVASQPTMFMTGPRSGHQRRCNIATGYAYEHV